MNKLKRACEHLEKLIEEKNNQILYEGKKPVSYEGTQIRVNKNIDLLYYTSGAGIVVPEDIKSGRYEARFRVKLKKAGLNKIQEDIIVLTFIYEDTIRDISKDLGIPSLTTVLRLRSDALKVLRNKWGKK